MRGCIGTRATADRLRDCDNSEEIGDNSAEIGDNSAEIGDNSAEIGDGILPQTWRYATFVDIATNQYRHKRDPMLNSAPNGDWSNSVPGRKIPEGPYWNSPVTQVCKKYPYLHD